MWGSGLIYNKNYILTCAHVVYDSSHVSIRDGENWISVSISHCLSSPLSWDFALLHSTIQLKTESINFNSNFEIGNIIKLQGYGLFYPKKENQVGLQTSGHVIKIVWWNGEPIYIITNGSAFGGQSGDK